MKNYDKKIESFSSPKDQEILKAIGSDLKPYVKKCDGYAKEIKEDVKVTYIDHDGHENVLTIPAGSIVKVMDYSTEIVTADDFNEGFVFHDEGSEVEREHEDQEKEEPKKKKKYGPIGMESLNS